MNFLDKLTHVSQEHKHAQQIKEILFLQQVSMRTYDTNEYQLLYDGNINLTLNRIYKLDKTYIVGITIPINHNKSHLQLLKQFVDANFECCVHFVQIKYGINADENRTVVPESSKTVIKRDQIVVSDFELVENADIYTFATSKVDGMPRPYVDKWLSVQQQLTSPIFVLNENQTVLLPNAIVQDKIMSVTLLNAKRDFHINAHDVSADIDYVADIAKSRHVIFFPFRISDRAYKFAEILSLAKIFGWMIVSTDTNHSGKDDDNVYYIKTDHKQTFYMQFLASSIPFCILCVEDYFEASHQSILELVYYAPNRFKFIGSTKNVGDYNAALLECLY